jgi:hypothetical protein
MREAELRDLAKYKAADISDCALAVAYLVAHGEWDKLAATLTRHRKAIDELAGITSQLLPIVPVEQPRKGRS